MFSVTHVPQGGIIMEKQEVEEWGQKVAGGGWEVDTTDEVKTSIGFKEVG